MQHSPKLNGALQRCANYRCEKSTVRAQRFYRKPRQSSASESVTKLITTCINCRRLNKPIQGCMSYSPSSSSNSPSSSAVASWYCWYSDTKSFMFDSASVNSISSMPSPVYQCKKALRRNMAVKYPATRLNISWMAVLLPANATAIFKPFGGISHMLTLMLLGIHSTKYEEFLFCTLSICSSTSLVLMRPRNSAARYCCDPRDVSGAKP